MQIQGTFQVKAPVEKVWNSLWDEQTLPVWVPGCTRASLSGNRVKATVEQSVGFLKARFDLDLEVVEREELKRVVLQGGGKDALTQSQVRLTLSLEMEPSQDGSTEVRYKADAQITGRIATIGHFVIQAKAKEIERELIQRVKAQLEGSG